jgi:hypothetical protein
MGSAIRVHLPRTMIEMQRAERKLPLANIQALHDAWEDKYLI